MELVGRDEKDVPGIGAAERDAGVGGEVVTADGDGGAAFKGAEARLDLDDAGLPCRGIAGDAELGVEREWWEGDDLERAWRER